VRINCGLHTCIKRARVGAPHTFIIYDKGLSTHYPRSISVRFGIVKVGEDFSEAPLVLDAY
jgi:hypothetical protein